MNPKTNKLAVAYVRVSTDEQASKGLSLEVQEAACIEAIKRDGYKLLKVIHDDGKSGGSLSKRNGMQEILQLVAAQKISALYTVKRDRFARNALEHLLMRDQFRKHDVQLQYVYEPMYDDSASSRTVDTILASVNEMQRLDTSEKVKKTLYAKAQAGYFPAGTPIGYRNVPNPDPTAGRLGSKIIVPDPITGVLITEAFKLYATGNYNTYDLNDLLYAKGLKTKQGKQIALNRFCEVLKNRIYLGEVHWGPVHVENGKHQSLTDKATFDRAQHVMAGNNNHACRRRKYEWLLNGFVCCFKHGKRYTAEWHLKKSIAYYHCTNRNGCGKYIQKERLESWIADKFQNLEFHPDFIQQVLTKVQQKFSERRKEHNGKRQALLNQKTAYEAKLQVAEEKLLERVITDADFTRMRSECSAGIAGINGRLADLENKQEIRFDIAQEVVRMTTNIYEAYNDATDSLKRHYLSLFWDKFEVADGVIIKSDPSLLFKELLRLQQVFYKNEETEKPTENVGPSLVINSGSLLRR